MRTEELGTSLTGQTARQKLLGRYCGRSCRAPFVVPQQPTQRLVADDIFQMEVMDWSRRWQSSFDRHVAEPLVRPVAMIV